MLQPPEYQNQRPQALPEREWFLEELAERRRLLGRMKMRGLVYLIQRLPLEIADERGWAALLVHLAREEILDREFGKPRDVAS